MAAPGPLQGIYQEFFLPIIKDPTKKQPSRGTEDGPEKFERAYVKEPVGFFLGLPLAPNRTGEFKGEASNKGRKFNYRKQRASKSFQLILKPNTKIKIYNAIEGKEEDVEKNSLSFSVPRTVGVSEVMAWLCHPADVLGPLKTAAGSSGAGGTTEYANYAEIIGIITPDNRRHNITNLLSTGSTGKITSDTSIAIERDTVTQ